MRSAGQEERARSDVINESGNCLLCTEQRHGGRGRRESESEERRDVVELRV